MPLYLIRHSKPGVGKSLCYGQTDIDVAESFTLELAVILRNEALPRQFDGIYSSPLLRCRRLAQALPAACTVQLDDRLREVHFGDWELQEWASINRMELDWWADDVVNRSPPGGESLRELYQRTRSFLESLDAVDDRRHIAVVTHAGVIRCVWAYVTGMPLANVFRVGVQYGEVLAVTLSNNPELRSIQAH